MGILKKANEEKQSPERPSAQTAEAEGGPSPENLDASADAGEASMMSGDEYEWVPVRPDTIDAPPCVSVDDRTVPTV